MRIVASDRVLLQPSVSSPATEAVLDRRLFYAWATARPP